MKTPPIKVGQRDKLCGLLANDETSALDHDLLRSRYAGKSCTYSSRGSSRTQLAVEGSPDGAVNGDASTRSARRLASYHAATTAQDRPRIAAPHLSGGTELS
jgi:hypothetical protein